VSGRRIPKVGDRFISADRFMGPKVRVVCKPSAEFSTAEMFEIQFEDGSRTNGVKSIEGFYKTYGDDVEWLTPEADHIVEGQRRRWKCPGGDGAEFVVGPAVDYHVLAYPRGQTANYQDCYILENSELIPGPKVLNRVAPFGDYDVIETTDGRRYVLEVPK